MPKILDNSFIHQLKVEFLLFVLFFTFLKLLKTLFDVYEPNTADKKVFVLEKKNWQKFLCDANRKFKCNNSRLQTLSKNISENIISNLYTTWVVDVQHFDRKKKTFSIRQKEKKVRTEFFICFPYGWEISFQENVPSSMPDAPQSQTLKNDD